MCQECALECEEQFNEEDRVKNQFNKFNRRDIKKAGFVDKKNKKVFTPYELNKLKNPPTLHRGHDSRFQFERVQDRTMLIVDSKDDTDGGQNQLHEETEYQRLRKVLSGFIEETDLLQKEPGMLIEDQSNERLETSLIMEYQQTLDKDHTDQQDLTAQITILEDFLQLTEDPAANQQSEFVPTSLQSEKFSVPSTILNYHKLQKQMKVLQGKDVVIAIGFNSIDVKELLMNVFEDDARTS